MDYVAGALTREILLPAAFPRSHGLRMGLAQAWLFLVAAELIAASGAWASC